MQQTRNPPSLVSNESITGSLLLFFLGGGGGGGGGQTCPSSLELLSMHILGILHCRGPSRLCISISFFFLVKIFVRVTGQACLTLRFESRLDSANTIHGYIPRYH